MICKTCGTTLGPYDEACPYCGTPVDFHAEAASYRNEPVRESEEERAERDEFEEEAAKPSVKERLADKYKSLPKPNLPDFRKLPKELVLAGAIGLAVLFSIIALIVAGGAVKKANDKVATLQDQINSMQYSVDAAYAKVSALEAQLASAPAQPSAPSDAPVANGEIIKSPSNEFAALGRTNVWIFSVEVKSQDDKYVWQKMDATTGEWVDVELSASGDAFTSVWEKTDKGARAKLIANTISESSFGSYRCVVTTASGAVAVSDAVTLSKA